MGIISVSKWHCSSITCSLMFTMRSNSKFRSPPFAKHPLFLSTGPCSNESFATSATLTLFVFPQMFLDLLMISNTFCLNFEAMVQTYKRDEFQVREMRVSTPLSSRYSWDHAWHWGCLVEPGQCASRGKLVQCQELYLQRWLWLVVSS